MRLVYATFSIKNAYLHVSMLAPAINPDWSKLIRINLPLNVNKWLAKIIVDDA